MSRCQIVSFFFFFLLLINRSSSFDNNDDHDYIMRSPTGDRRLTFSPSVFLAISIHRQFFFLVYVRRLEQRWLVIRRRVFVCVHEWPFPVSGYFMYTLFFRLLFFSAKYSLRKPWKVKSLYRSIWTSLSMKYSFLIYFNVHLETRRTFDELEFVFPRYNHQYNNKQIIRRAANRFSMTYWLEQKI